MPAILLYSAAFLLYAALAFHFWRTRWRGSGTPRIARWERAAVLVPLALHTWLVYDMLLASQELRFGFGHALSMMLWLAVIIYWVESRFLELEGMQAPVLALAAVCVPLPALFPGLASPSSAHSTELRLHLVLAMIAYGLFTIAALHGSKPGDRKSDCSSTCECRNDGVSHGEEPSEARICGGTSSLQGGTHVPY